LENNPQVVSILNDLIDRYPALIECKGDILQAYHYLSNSFHHQGKLLVCGNGGSAADSEHIVGELLKGFLLPRKINERFRNKLAKMYPEDGMELSGKIQEALPAISLTGQTPFFTAFANDVSPDTVFAQQVYALGHKEDTLIAISTSGNSKNVLNAVKIARTVGMKTIGLTGKTGGSLKELCDTSICVPATQTHRIQEMHLPVYHALCAMLEAEFFFTP